jgi:hypothetical protein
VKGDRIIVCSMLDDTTKFVDSSRDKAMPNRFSCHFWEYFEDLTNSFWWVQTKPLRSIKSLGTGK